MIYHENRYTSHMTGDALVHLSFVRELFRTGGKKIDMSWKFLLDTSDYPTGFHRLIYWLKIPLFRLERWGGWIPIIADIAITSLIAAVMEFVGGGVNAWLIIYPLCRMTFGHVGRAIHFSERAYSTFFANAYLTTKFLVVFYGLNETWLVVSLLSFTVASVSSKFAWQGIVFVTFIVSFLELNFFPVVILMICVVASALITRLESMRVLGGLIRHSTFYKQTLEAKHPVMREHYSEVASIRTWNDFWEAFTKNSLFKIFTDLPLNILIISLLYSESISLDWWVSWVVAGWLLVVFTSVNGLRFLGEPERYLEFSFIPAFFLLSIVTNYSNVAVICTIAVTLVILVHFLHSFFYSVKLQAPISLQAQEIKQWVNDTPNGLILTIPLRYSFLWHHFDSDDSHTFLNLHCNIGKGELGEKFERLLGERYPFVERNIEAIIEQYKVDFILVDKGAVAHLHRELPDYYERFNRFSIFRESSLFMLLDVRNVSR